MVKKSIKKEEGAKGDAQLKGNLRATKNLVLNFSKAICNFALSDLADPYLDDMVRDTVIEKARFWEFTKVAKVKIGGIGGLKTIIIEHKNDSEQIKIYKRIFFKIAEIFIKNFSVNWIVHSRLKHKPTYLKYRLKMLRSIRSPESFTSIKDGRRKKQIW